MVKIIVCKECGNVFEICQDLKGNEWLDCPHCEDIEIHCDIERVEL